MPLKQKNISGRKVIITIAALLIVALAVISFAPTQHVAEIVLFQDVSGFGSDEPHRNIS